MQGICKDRVIAIRRSEAEPNGKLWEPIGRISNSEESGVRLNSRRRIKKKLWYACNLTENRNDGLAVFS